MKVCIALLTYNRKSLFLSTYSSLFNAGHAFDIVIVDNGSTDGTAEIVAGLGGILNTSDNHTTGYGMNIAINAALEKKPSLVVFSADDYTYRPDWLANLVRFWNEAPEDVALTTCHLEPHWGWNGIFETGDIGAQHYAIRESVPGSSWTFRAKMAGAIMPIQESTGGEDLSVCKRLRDHGYKLAALDLAEHTGEQASAWGNESWRYAKPFDYGLYGFERPEGA